MLSAWFRRSCGGFWGRFWVLGGWVVGVVGARGVRFRGLWGERKFVNFGAEQKLPKNLMLNPSHDGQKFPKIFLGQFSCAGPWAWGGFLWPRGPGWLCLCPLVGALGAPAKRGRGRASSRSPAKVGRSWPVSVVGGGLGWLCSGGGRFAGLVGRGLLLWGAGGGATLPSSCLKISVFSNFLSVYFFRVFQTPPTPPPLRH